MSVSFKTGDKFFDQISALKKRLEVIEKNVDALGNFSNVQIEKPALFGSDIELENFRRELNESYERDQILKKYIFGGQLNIALSLEKITSDADALEKDLASVTVNIPSVYDHLVIFSSGQTDAAGAYVDFLDMQFNGDTGANYHFGYLYNISTALTGVEALAQTHLRFLDVSGASANANSVSGAFVFIPHIQSLTWKTAYAVSGGEQVNVGGNQRTTLRSGFWKDTAPITSILFYPDQGTVIKAGSKISVYGLR